MKGKMISRDEMLAIPAFEISDLSRMAPDPIVSVIVVTYNHEAYIAQNIEGILAQDCDFPIELIIGEDHSNDRTLEICLRFQREYPEVIRVVTGQENIGIGGNYLRVLGRARGKYLAFCEGDDYWIDPGKLTKQVALMEQWPDTTLCGARTLWLDTSKPDLPGEVRGPKHTKGQYGLEDVIDLPLPLFHTSTFLFRAAEFNYPECARSLLLWDTVLQAAAAVRGSVRCIPDTVSVYRLHGSGSLTGLESAGQNEHSIEIFQAILTFTDPIYYPMIEKRIDTYRTWLCFALVSNGQKQLARKLAWETFWRLARYAPKRAIGLIVHVCLPRTFRLALDACNRLKRGCGETNEVQR
jgi:glycosyltransferase involved in cell wall biosynthesis